MSNYQQLTKHPITGKWEFATWIDDHFGPHRYGIHFRDGKIFREEQIQSIEVNGVAAECDTNKTTITHWEGEQT